MHVRPERNLTGKEKTGQVTYYVCTSEIHNSTSLVCTLVHMSGSTLVFTMLMCYSIAIFEIDTHSKPRKTRFCSVLKHAENYFLLFSWNMLNDVYINMALC